MKHFIILLFSLLTIQLVAQRFLDPPPQLHNIKEAQQVVDSLNNLNANKYLELDRLTKKISDDVAIIKAIFYCDEQGEYCKCSTHDDCIDLRYGLKYKGEFVLKPFANKIIEHEENKVLCHLKEKVWVADYAGNVIEAPHCVDHIYFFYRLQKNGKYGVINQQLNTMIPFEYEWIGKRNYVSFMVMDWTNEFEEELHTYSAKKDGKYGIIDDQNTARLPFKYEGIDQDFTKEMIPVKLNGKWGIVDFDENNILPFEYDSIMKYGSLIALKKGKWGLVSDLKEVAKTKFQFDDLKRLSGNTSSGIKFYGKKGKVWGAFNSKIELQGEMIYKDIKILPNEGYWWDVPVVGYLKGGKWALYYTGDKNVGFKSDFIYDKIVSGLYMRGQKGATDYPLYRVIVEEKGKKKELFFSDYD